MPMHGRTSLVSVIVIPPTSAVEVIELVLLCVCLSALSLLNRLTYGHKILHGDPMQLDNVLGTLDDEGHGSKIRVASLGNVIFFSNFTHLDGHISWHDII